MDIIHIRGGRRLSGRVAISGAKNAALTLMPCALLTDEILQLTNLPRLAEVDSFMHLLNVLGVSTMVKGARGQSQVGRAMTLKASSIASTVAPARGSRPHATPTAAASRSLSMPPSER